MKPNFLNNECKLYYKRIVPKAEFFKINTLNIFLIWNNSNWESAKKNRLWYSYQRRFEWM